MGNVLGWCTPLSGKATAHVFLALPDGRYRVLCGNMKRDIGYVPRVVLSPATHALPGLRAADGAVNDDEIKAYALEHGCRVDDLLPMSRMNDPFYCGQPSQIAQAKWFLSLWERFDLPQGVHLRRIHYLLVSQDPPILDACGTV